MAAQPKYVQPSGYGVLVAPKTSRLDVVVFWLFLIPAALICLALYLAQAVDAVILVAAVTFTLAVIVAPQVGLYVYFAWQAFDAVFVSSKSAIFTPAKAFAPFLLVLFVLRVGRLTSPDLQVSRSFVLTMLLFGFYGLVGALGAYQPWMAIRYAMQIIVQVLLVVMTIQVVNAREYVGRLMLATVAGGAAAALVVLLPSTALPSILAHGGGRASIGEFADPNTTALALGIALAAIPAAWAYTKRKGFYLFYLAAAPALFVAMLATGSRSGLVTVFSASAFGALLAKGAGLIKRVLIALVCTLMLGYVFVQVMHSDILQPMSRERIEEFVYAGGEVGGNVRLDIWKLGLKTYAKGPFMGFGFGNTAYALEQAHGWYKDIHSSYLGALVDGGPVGFLLFGYALWQLIKCVRRTRRSPAAIPATIMLVLLLVSCLTLTTHFSKWFWVPVSICLVLAEQAKREQAEQQAALLSGYAIQPISK